MELKLIQKLNGVMLDFGCGTKAYEHLFKVEKYIGVDLEKNDGHNLPPDKIDFFYNGKKLPFKNDNFDSIFLQRFLNMFLILKKFYLK